VLTVFALARTLFGIEKEVLIASSVHFLPVPLHPAWSMMLPEQTPDHYTFLVLETMSTLSTILCGIFPARRNIE